MNRPRDIVLYDTTLRDGMQREGLSVSVEEKIRIARRLADLGIHVIEGGFPGSNPKDEEFFRRLEREHLGDTTIAAFGMTRAKGETAERDPKLRVLAESWAPMATIVGKTWDLHVEKVLRVDREENLRMIAESVAFLCAQGKRVTYDAEHFFDALLGSPRLRTCLSQSGGRGGGGVGRASATPTGPRFPDQVAEAVDDVVAALGACRVGIHTHNDSGCAVANALVAVDRGRRLRAGHHQRLRRALRQRRPVRRSSPRSSSRWASTASPTESGEAHRHRPLRGRTLQRLARPAPALRGPQRLRAQGRPARVGGRARSHHLRAHRAGAGGQRAARAGVGAVRRATIAQRASELGYPVDSRERAGRPGAQAPQGERA